MNERIKKPLGEKARILIVEDEDIIMRAILMFTQRLSHAVEVVEAENCKEGIRLIENQEFDAVLTDFNSPGGANGNDVAARATELKIPKITIMTGGHADLVKPEFDLMHKPMDREQLRAWFADAVRIALERRGATEKAEGENAAPEDDYR